MDIKTSNVLFLDGKYEQAANAYYEAALEGDAEAAFNYGYCKLFGIGTERDEREAKSFFTYAKELPGGEAAYNLAVMHLHGVGVKRDYKKVYSYMHDAAVLGSIEAQLYLGIAHTLGSLFEPDIIAISRIPFHTPIYRQEGNLLGGYAEPDEEDEELRQSAVRFDPVSAFEWFGIAARHDATYVEELSGKGKFLYARCFADGLGTEFNRDRANRLMLLAAKDGSEEAMVYLRTEAPYVLEALDNDELLATIRKTERILPPA